MTIPAHASGPAEPRDDPRHERAIIVSLHGHTEERELFAEIERMVSESGEDVRLDRVGIRDGASSIIINIGVSIAANLITEIIKTLAQRLKAQNRTKVYIHPSYAPKRVFRLPDEEKEALDHFRKYPSHL